MGVGVTCMGTHVPSVECSAPCALAGVGHAASATDISTLHLRTHPPLPTHTHILPIPLLPSTHTHPAVYSRCVHACACLLCCSLSQRSVCSVEAVRSLGCCTWSSPEERREHLSPAHQSFYCLHFYELSFDKNVVQIS